MAIFDPQAWANPACRALQPYRPGRSERDLRMDHGIHDAVKLASNENPLGCSPDACQAVADSLLEGHRYPAGDASPLRQAVAQYWQVEDDMLSFGNGSNDVLDLIARSFLTPDRSAVFSRYAFAVYALVIQACGAKMRPAEAYAADHSQPLGHDPQALLAAIDDDCRLLFIANPNNPTGSTLSDAELEKLLVELPTGVLVVLDEAYYEYHRPATSRRDWLARFPHLIVVRSFSKAYGLAGLRCGYAVSDPAVADLINRVRQPFNCNHLALVAATAALADQSFVARSEAINAAGKGFLEQGFQRRGLRYLPTAGNFLCLHIGPQAAAIYQGLQQQGVIVRPLENYGLEHYLRITIGTHSQCERLLQALDTVLVDST